MNNDLKSLINCRFEMNKVHNINCLDFMKDIPDNFFDLILTDPPYGIGMDKRMSLQSGIKSGNAACAKNEYIASNWDNSIPSAEIFEQMLRVSKNAIIFGGNYFIECLHNSPCWLVWDKDNGTNKFADCELAWTNYKGAVRKYTFTWNGMLQADMRHKEIRYHPTQKPVKLFTAILQDYAKSGYKIFDPFMGSGTTAIACKSLNLEWVGCELESHYVSIIHKRLQEVQGDLLGCQSNIRKE